MTRRIVLVFVSAALLARPVVAQQAAAPATGLQIEQIQSGFVVAPDVRFTDVNDRAATLAGVYGGWLTDRTLLIGGGAYWLANRADDFKMQYFGGLVRWTIGGRRRFGVSPGGLIGFGDATLGARYGDLFDDARQAGADAARMAAQHGFRAISSDARVRVHDGFFVAEPQVNALWEITPWLRLNAGAGYRFIGATDLLGDELRGPSGSIGIQFGGK